MFRNFVSATYDTFNVSATMTKSTAVDPYSINDVMSDSTSAPTVITFSNVGTYLGQPLCISDVSITDTVYSTSLLPSFNLWLFNAAPTAINDNLPLAITDAENDTVVAVIPLIDSYHGSTNNARFEASGIQHLVKLSTTVMDLYGVLEVTSTYTPAIAETLKITVKGYRL